MTDNNLTVSLEASSDTSLKPHWSSQLTTISMAEQWSVHMMIPPSWSSWSSRSPPRSKSSSTHPHNWQLPNQMNAKKWIWWGSPSSILSPSPWPRHPPSLCQVRCLEVSFEMDSLDSFWNDFCSSLCSSCCALDAKTTLCFVLGEVAVVFIIAIHSYFLAYSSCVWVERKQFVSLDCVDCSGSHN